MWQLFGDQLERHAWKTLWRAQSPTTDRRGLRAHRTAEAADAAMVRAVKVEEDNR